MKKLLAAIMTMFMVCFLTACNTEDNAPAEISAEALTEENERKPYDRLAEDFVKALADGDFDTAAGMFDQDMSRVYGAAALQADWEAIIAQAGAFVDLYETENEIIDGYHVCHTTSRHTNTGVTLRIVFDGEARVAGFFIMDYPVIGGEAEGFTDFPVIVGEGSEFPLKGVLSIPNNAEGKIPAVIIVHGSGAVDMNCSLYGTTMYKDIAEYLAAKGIAVLRYNKRTYEHGEAVSEKYGENLTVREETIDDVVSARLLLEADERIDADRIFLLGHSLGGMLAPRIIGEYGGFAGGIIMAGSPRGLLDIVYDQNLYFIGLADINGKERGALIAQVEEARNEYFGMPRLYIDEMNEHPAADFLLSAERPFLIMHGGKDFQVYTGADFELYKEIAADSVNPDNFTFKLYDGLNHLFMLSVMENPTIEDYAAGSKVESEPLADIAEWISNR